MMRSESLSGIAQCGESLLKMAVSFTRLTSRPRVAFGLRSIKRVAVQNMRTEPSPCVGICTMDDTGVCEGCGRTRHEIAVWSSLNEEQRRCVARCAEHRMKVKDDQHGR
jgi:predicted Fe-S protein YdhL (DUF1289 family)